MDRRDFLVCGALSLIARRVMAQPAIVQPAPMKFGYAAITWGGNDRAAIDDISAVGFRGVQLRAPAVTEWESRPEELKQMLQSRNLKFVALSGGLVRLDPAKEAEDIALQVRNAQFVRAAGGAYLQVVDERPTGRAPGNDDFRRMGTLDRRRYIRRLGEHRILLAGDRAVDAFGIGATTEHSSLSGR